MENLWHDLLFFYLLACLEASVFIVTFNENTNHLFPLM